MTEKFYDETGLQVLRPAGSRWETGLRSWIAAIPPEDRGTIVEVGSWRGESSVWLAKYFRYVICVDSWVDLEAQHNDFLMRTAAIKNITYLRMPSVEAAHTFQRGELDAVYIDANHTWAGVVADITAWRPKVRKGGWIGGHDYTDGCAVKKAVDHYYPKARIFEDTSWIIQS